MSDTQQQQTPATQIDQLRAELRQLEQRQYTANQLDRGVDQRDSAAREQLRVEIAQLEQQQRHTPSPSYLYQCQRCGALHTTRELVDSVYCDCAWRHIEARLIDTTPEQIAYDALSVIALTAHIAEYLDRADPQALAQVQRARTALRSITSVK